MLDAAEVKMIDQGWLTLNIIWMAMLASLAAYLFVGLFLKDQLHFSAAGEFPIGALRKALYAAAIVAIILARYIRNYMLEKKEDRGIIKEVRPATVVDQHPAVIKYSKAVISSLALAESAGIFGLVLLFLGNNAMDLFVLLAISVAALIYYRPHKEELLHLANSIKRSTS